MPDTEHRYYSVDQVATILEVSPRTVRNLINRGRFPGTHKLDPGSEKSSYRIPKKDLEDFVNSQKPDS